MYADGVISTEVRLGCRLLVVDSQFTLLLSSSLLPLNIVDSLATELAKLHADSDEAASIRGFSK
jgi:hypothetical protein